MKKLLYAITQTKSIDADVGPISIPERFLIGSKTSSTGFLEKTGSMMQSFTPINNIHCHLSAFHCYHEDRTRHVQAHHYCSHISEDFIQCLIYDSSDAKTAKLIGIEYVISKDLLVQLPPEEKQYWHPHVYEIKAGLLVADGVPGMMEDPLMKKLIGTYGKTWHFWQVDRGDPLPVGPAKLMSGYYKDGELPFQFIELRDQKSNTDTREKIKRRQDFEYPAIDPDASA